MGIETNIEKKTSISVSYKMSSCKICDCIPTPDNDKMVEGFGNEKGEAVKMCSSLFSDFYQEYLGLSDKILHNDVQVCKCKYRDIPINKRYYYKVIATTYNGEKIISCSPEFKEAEIVFLCRNINFEAIGAGDIHNEFTMPEYELSYMDRMLLNSQPDINEDTLSVYTRHDQIEYRYLEAYKKYIALINEELVGYCKVSDVISDYGNLVVWVEESKRRLGIAESLVKLMINKCYEERIVTMYVVKTDNHASKALAKKLGFQLIQRELVVSYNELLSGVATSEKKG